MTIKSWKQRTLDSEWVTETLDTQRVTETLDTERATETQDGDLIKSVTKETKEGEESVTKETKEGEESVTKEMKEGEESVTKETKEGEENQDAVNRNQGKLRSAIKMERSVWFITNINVDRMLYREGKPQELVLCGPPPLLNSLDSP